MARTMTPTGMDTTTGQFEIAQNGDSIQVGNASLVQTIFTGTADAVVTNTTTETSAIGTGTGSKTILANSLFVGRTIRIEGGGVYSAAAIAPGNLTVKVKFGSTVIATVVLGSILSAASTLGFQFDCDIVCRTTGTTGTLMTSGSIDYASSTLGARLFGDLNNGGVVTTIDTTVDQVLDVTVTWQTASTSNILKTTYTTVEVLW